MRLIPSWRQAMINDCSSPSTKCKHMLSCISVLLSTVKRSSRASEVVSNVLERVYSSPKHSTRIRSCLIVSLQCCCAHSNGYSALVLSRYFNSENDLVDGVLPQWGGTETPGLSWPLATLLNFIVANGTATMLCPGQYPHFVSH